MWTLLQDVIAGFGSRDVNQAHAFYAAALARVMPLLVFLQGLFGMAGNNRRLIELR